MRGSILLLAGLILGSAEPTCAESAGGSAPVIQPDLRGSRESGDGGLRDAARLAAFIERLDAVRKAGDLLPVHALDLSLRTAVQRELAEGKAEHSRGREVRLQSASRIGFGDEGLERDEAYSTPVAATVDPDDIPPATTRKQPRRKQSPVADADFERRRRAVINELGQLDGVLDDAGLNARRDLLVMLLEIARERDLLRNQRDVVED